MILTDLLSHGVARWPDKTCVVESDRSLTFGEVDHRAERLAQAFTAQGLIPGDRVALLALNEIEFIEIQVAAQRAGVILVPINFRLSQSEIEAIVEDCEPKLLIHGPGFTDAAAPLSVATTWYLGGDGVGESYEDTLKRFAPTPHRAAIDSSRECLIMYTSGTTGRPKGVVISNGAFWARLTLCAIETAARVGDEMLFPTPMFHASSSIAFAFTARGLPIVLMRAFDLDGAIQLLESRPISHALLVPTIIQRMAERLEAEPRTLAKLRLVAYGGSAISPSSMKKAMAVLGCEFVQFYGLTEAFNATSLRPEQIDIDRHPDRLSSAGTASISFDVKVVDEQREDVAPDVVGEIVLRGPCLMDRYWNAPEATADAIRDGWFRTGDLGRISPEGFLFVTDRLKDMIKSGGENVYAREVEDILHEHPDVLEVAVFGIPNELWGETVHAVVVGRGDARLDPDDLTRHCRERLAAFKVPKSFEVVGSLQKNALGKIVKRELKAPYWRGKERVIG